MRFTNLNMDISLGGNNASDEQIASQKAIKTYVDENDKDNIEEMDDVSISEVSNGQLLSYDSSLQKWINKNANPGLILRDWTE